MNRDLIARYRAFRAMGVGGVVGRDAERCLDLARAEILADEIGLVVRWEYEPDPDQDCLDEQGWADYRAGLLECLCAHVRGDGETLAALGCIWIRVEDRDYRRLVEAELLSESIHEIRYAREMGTAPYADCGGAA